MALYKNVMEDIVEQKYDEVKDALGCCTCEQCKSDLIAYVLNQLPPKYVMTQEGSLYTKLTLVRKQYQVDVISALTQAAEIIRQHPRHN